MLHGEPEMVGERGGGYNDSLCQCLVEWRQTPRGAESWTQARTPGHGLPTRNPAGLLPVGAHGPVRLDPRSSITRSRRSPGYRPGSAARRLVMPSARCSPIVTIDWCSLVSQMTGTRSRWSRWRRLNGPRSARRTMEQDEAASPISWFECARRSPDSVSGNPCFSRTFPLGSRLSPVRLRCPRPASSVSRHPRKTRRDNRAAGRRHGGRSGLLILRSVNFDDDHLYELSYRDPPGPLGQGDASGCDEALLATKSASANCRWNRAARCGCGTISETVGVSRSASSASKRPAARNAARASWPATAPRRSSTVTTGSLAHREGKNGHTVTRPADAQRDPS